MKKIIFLLLCAPCFWLTSDAQSVKYCSSENVAIKGYDPVAYFIQNQAMEGTDQFTTEWSGSKWKFISQANLDRFKKDPSKYAPQYGGYCAYGCSENHKSATDPKAFTIINDKLYLNYNLKVKQIWLQDTAKRINAADLFWPALNK